LRQAIYVIPWVIFGNNASLQNIRKNRRSLACRAKCAPLCNLWRAWTQNNFVTNPNNSWLNTKNKNSHSRLYIFKSMATW